MSRIFPKRGRPAGCGIGTVVPVMFATEKKAETGDFKSQNRGPDDEEETTALQAVC
jgi:hypothetical protein